MRNFVWSFFIILSVVFSSFSQTKSIEKGTYISSDKGQKILLNLLENNKYELVFYSGDYQIKGDSLLFVKKIKAENPFDLTFKNDKKAQKIKIKFIDPSYYPFYIGTQNGSETIDYQKVTDLRTKLDPDWLKNDLEFEIEKADYLYLVYEDPQGESKLSKYALAKDVSEVTIKYEMNVLGDLNISGLFDQKTNELRIFEKSGKNPLTFLNEKDIKPETISKVIPLETQNIANWTYPGKEPLVTDDFGSDIAVDSTAVADYGSPKFDFKFKLENNLKAAVAATKTSKTKYLVIYNDNKKTAKADFNAVVKDLEVQVGYYMYEQYNPQYDVFNYYLAGADDKKWLKTNKISDNPGIIILNGDGDILATSKATLLDKKAEFTYYEDLYKKLQRADALLSFNKAIKNKKPADADLIQAFNKISSLDIPYEYETESTIDNVPDPAAFVIVKNVLDKKEVSQAWKKLIEAHQKDTKPNRELVETILKELKNQGFEKQFSSEEKVFNDSDFLSIDYLLKHYDAVEKMNIEDENGNAIPLLMGSLSTEIASDLERNSNIDFENVANEANKNKTIAIYKKLIASGKGSFECYKNYFAFLNRDSEKSIDDLAYLKEFSTYFDTYLSTEKGNAIERLDEIYSKVDLNQEYTYNGWSVFKEYHSNLANSAAWMVVLKPTNSNFLKSAIVWSEYSLVVTKNNPYYLDTLAQLYYKDGQKEKGIATQTLAVKYLNAEIEEETATEMKETLTKMQNGTY